ncbi:MAG: hypothetical protein H0V72_30330 [Bradyrhizobium sp.]|nr:hypothetical protein [Bradyrhizobium sp.]
MIDDAFDPVRTSTHQIFRGQPKRQMRPPFDGIQILGNRLKGATQSLQLRKGIGQSAHHNKNLNSP